MLAQSWKLDKKVSKYGVRVGGSKLDHFSLFVFLFLCPSLSHKPTFIMTRQLLFLRQSLTDDQLNQGRNTTNALKVCRQHMALSCESGDSDLLALSANVCWLRSQSKSYLKVSNLFFTHKETFDSFPSVRAQIYSHYKI